MLSPSASAGSLSDVYKRQSILDGEITETGVGLVLRRKMDRLSELFIFRKKKIKPEAENSDMKK